MPFIGNLHGISVPSLCFSNDFFSTSLLSGSKSGDQSLLFKMLRSHVCSGGLMHAVSMNLSVESGLIPSLINDQLMVTQHLNRHGRLHLYDIHVNLTVIVCMVFGKMERLTCVTISLQSVRTRWHVPLHWMPNQLFWNRSHPS